VIGGSGHPGATGHSVVASLAFRRVMDTDLGTVQTAQSPARLSARSRATATAARRIPWAGLPRTLAVVAFLAAGWSRRWTSDDAFINFRVIKQIEAGHGPVYNAGERVEVATSTLWLAILTVVDVFTPIRLEWAAVLTQLALGAAGVAFGMAGAVRLARLRRPDPRPDVAGGPIVPLGAAAYLAVAATWDYATGGLENSLGLAWLGGTFWAVTVLVDRSAAGDPGRRRLLATALLVGLGVLVRPDFVVYSAGFALPVAVVAWRHGRARCLVGVAAAAGALPLVVQVFRMGYYAQLVPNTLHTKESGMAWWGQGWRYLADLFTTYGLVVPVAGAAAWLALAWLGPVDRSGPTGRRRDWRLVVGGVEGAAVLHALGVVRVGGDYMHGRLLLAAWFALLLPVLAVPLGDLRPRCHAAIAVAIGAWALAAALWSRPVEGTLFNATAVGRAPPGALRNVGASPPLGIIDMRSIAVSDSHEVRHPVEWDDYEFAHASGGAERGDRRQYLPGVFVAGWGLAYPTAPHIDAMVVPGYTLGARGYAEDLDVWVYDRLGLADPVVARAELVERGTAGHEKVLGPPWVAAAWVDPGITVDDPAAFAALSPLALTWSGTAPPDQVDADEFADDREAAYDALQCGELLELVHDVRAPLSPQRFVGNIFDSVRLHPLRVPADPDAARARFCG
jgi:arabinofuranosyltransferase